MQHTSTPLFHEVIQMATPDCVKRRDMTLIRKLKSLQTYTERIEKLLDDAMSTLEDATK